MMFSIKTIEACTNLLALGIAYILSATTAGYVQAWVAKHCGDDTPEMAGFLTWNPFVHIDFIGALCLFLLKIGWSKILPINPSLIKSTIRLLFVFLTKPLVYVTTACISLLFLLKIFGLTILNVSMIMIVSGYVSLPVLANAYPQSSSLILSIAIILVALVYVGVLFAVLDFILGCFRFLQVTYLSYLAYSPMGVFIEFLIAFFAIMIFAGPLRMFIVYIILQVAYMLAPLLGVL